MTLVRVQNDHGQSFQWNDAIVAARTSDDHWAITSPNMNFIPSPSISVIQVILREDCRYGSVDPIAWPQTFSQGFEYLAAILRPDKGHNKLAPIWWSPGENEFEHIDGSVIKCLGLLRRTSVEPLSELVDELSREISAHGGARDKTLSHFEAAMRHARDRLFCFPCTWHDVCLQVRLTQRFWLMARAFIDFHAVYPTSGTPRPTNTHFMGAFTTDPETVQSLFAAGIPVWWLRLDLSILSNTRVRAIVELLQPDNKCLAIAPGYGDVLYRGLSGPKHLQALSHSGHTYQDVSHTVLLAVQLDCGYRAPASQNDFKKGHGANDNISTSRGRVRPSGNSASQSIKPHPYHRPHGTQVRGVNKFEAIQHEWMPPGLAVWERAMANVDLSQPARPQSEIWGYWVPDPGLLIRPQSADRRERYVYNWLRMRAAWLYILRLREARVTLIPTKWWRDFLYGETGRVQRNHDTRNGQRMDLMQQAFGAAFRLADYDPATVAPVRWFGYLLPRIEEKLCKMILWEVCELGFRHELLAVDRLLVPGRDGTFDEEEREELLSGLFGDHSLFCVTDLPQQGVGLSAATPFHRVPYLESFRRVLSRWPRAPASIYIHGPITTSLPAEEIVQREYDLVAFYVQTFFEQSGRAPIIPHAVPMS